MSVTDQYLKNNEAYAARFSGPLPLPPANHVAVVATTVSVTMRDLTRPTAPQLGFAFNLYSIANDRIFPRTRPERSRAGDPLEQNVPEGQQPP